MPEVVMNTWSPLPRSTTLVSPVTSATPASSQACRMESTMRCRSSIGKTFFKNERGRKKQRPGAADGQIVDRAVNCELADVAAGKEEGRTTNESVVKAIRGPLTPLWRAWQVERGLIFQRRAGPRCRRRARTAGGSGRWSAGRRCRGRAGCGRNATCGTGQLPNSIDVASRWFRRRALRSRCIDALAD